jgi:predicted negative regulator of RcsB-dependent stress response
MNVRSLLVFTGIVSSILGALVVYLVLSVPNDLRADGLLKDARKQMTDGKTEDAKRSLSTIVQQYPRTDAAAAATVALVSLADKDRNDLARAVSQLRKQNDQQTQLITDLQKSVSAIQNAPPKVVTVQAPAPQPAAKKVTPKKAAPKKTTKKKTTRRRR